MLESCHVAEQVGHLGDRTLVPTAFGGHCYYVRKCVTGEQATGNDFWDRKIGRIHIPQTAAEHSQIVEVLALGPAVCKKCTPAHAKLYKRPRRLADSAAVGDFLLCPDSVAGVMGIKRSPLADHEFFIEESVPLAVIAAEAEDGGEACRN